MIKKPITYKNFDDVVVTTNFYFNFTKAEIVSIVAKDKNVIERFQEAMESGKPEDFIEPFEWIVSKSYGVRKDDMFIKTPEAERAFLTSEPYSELFTELLTDTDKAVEFFTGVFPKELVDQARADLNIKPTETVELPAEKTADEYTADELVAMPDDKFYELMGTNPRKWSKQVMAVAMRRSTAQ